MAVDFERVDGRARGLRPRRASDRLGLDALLGNLDWLLLAGLLATVAYGLTAINGITRHDAGGSALDRQALYAGAGLVVFCIALLIDPARYRSLQRPIYAGMLGVMLVVLALGTVSRGSKRSIRPT